MGDCTGADGSPKPSEPKWYDEHLERARTLVQASRQSADRDVAGALMDKARESARKYADRYVYDMAEDLDILSRIAARSMLTDHGRPDSVCERMSLELVRGPVYWNALSWAIAVWRVAYDTALERQCKYDVWDTP